MLLNELFCLSLMFGNIKDSLALGDLRKTEKFTLFLITFPQQLIRIANTVVCTKLVPLAIDIILFPMQ